MAAGTTDIAVISLGGLVTYRTLKVAGDARWTTAIIQYVRRRSNILIGERTAEQVKTRIGNVHASVDKGRDGGSRGATSSPVCPGRSRSPEPTCAKL